MKQQAQMYECRECSFIPDANAVDLHRCQHCGARGSIVPVESSPAEPPAAPPAAPPVDPNSAVIRMSPWRVERKAKVLRRVGKTGEEAAELIKILFRIVIQGLEGIDPATGKTNVEAMEEEIADAYLQLDLSVEQFDLDPKRIVERMERKRANMVEWEELVKDDV